MATRAQLEKYAKNPNVRKFLDLIAYTEGTQGNSYHTAFGGGRLSNLNDHPRYSKSFRQLNGKMNTTSAAGRYQFLRGTWDGVARQYGLTNFSPHNQDLGAIALMIGRDALAPLLKGDWQTAVRRAGPEWASFPTAPASYSQPTKSWSKVNKFWTGNSTPSGGGQGQPDSGSSEFARPPLIDMSGFQASEFERPPLIDMSGFHPEASAFERPALVNMADIQGGMSAPDIEPSAFERPKLVNMADIQVSDSAPDTEIDPISFERPALVNMTGLNSYSPPTTFLSEIEPDG